MGESRSFVIAIVGRLCSRAAASTPTTSGERPDCEIPITAAPPRHGGEWPCPNSQGVASADADSGLRAEQVLGVAGGVVGAAARGDHHVVDVRPPQQVGRRPCARLRDRQPPGERSPLVAELMFEERGQDVLFGNLTPIRVVNRTLTRLDGPVRVLSTRFLTRTGQTRGRDDEAYRDRDPADLGGARRGPGACSLRRRRRQQQLQLGGGPDLRPGQAVRPHDVERLHRPRARRPRRDHQQVRAAEPERQRRQRRQRQRRQDRRRAARRQRPRRHALVQHRQHRRLLFLGRVDRPQPVHRARQGRDRRLPPGGPGLHRVPGQPVRDAAARRRLRPLLQPGHVRRRPGSSRLRRPSRSSTRTRRSSRSGPRMARSRSPATSRPQGSTRASPRTTRRSGTRNGRTPTASRAWRATRNGPTISSGTRT